MAKTSNSKVKLTPNGARHGPSRKHIVKGKGPTAANPKPAIKAKVGYLKGPKAV